MRLSREKRAKIAPLLDRLVTDVKNCGTGAGGFKPGNRCGRGGGGAAPAPKVQTGGHASGGGETKGKTEFAGKPHNPQGKDTEQQYKRPDGTWTPERQVLHDKIVNQFLSGATPVKNPTAIMMGGGPASGKSKAIEGGHVNLPKNRVHIDSDEIKKHIPEYNKGVAAKDLNAAAFAHEESSYLSERILREASAKSLNVALDGTGDSGIGRLSEKVDIMRSKGARVSATYMTCDVSEALKRNEIRAQKTGRLPPETMVRNTHKAVSLIVPEALKRGLYDDFKLIDTNDGKTSVVATAKGRELTVHNQALWDRFLAKGAE